MMVADATADAAVLAVLGSLASAVVVVVGANIVLLIQDRRHFLSEPGSGIRFVPEGVDGEEA